MGQGDDSLPGTSKTMINVAMVPLILMAGLRSASCKTKKSDRTLTGDTLEIEIPSQCSALGDFKPSCMKQEKRSVVRQLTTVEHNRLTVSDTVSINEPAGGYMEMMKNRNSARVHLIALENEKIKCQGIIPGKKLIRGTQLHQKAYGTLASSMMYTETVDQLVNFLWRAVVRHRFDFRRRDAN